MVAKKIFALLISKSTKTDFIGLWSRSLKIRNNREQSKDDSMKAQLQKSEIMWDWLLWDWFNKLVGFIYIYIFCCSWEFRIPPCRGGGCTCCSLLHLPNHLRWNVTKGKMKAYPILIFSFVKFLLLDPKIQIKRAIA